jgi:hypothetical protein
MDLASEAHCDRNLSDLHARMRRRHYVNETFRKVTIVLSAAISAVITITILIVPTTVLSQANVGTCFTTIAAINAEMQQELDRISGGGTPESTYSYVFCPNAFFDATNTSLVPLLDNVMFLCGADGSLSNNCVIVGGSEQVTFRNSTVSGYVINQVAFMGLTFAGFQSNTNTAMSASVVASASAPTVAKFSNVVWQVRIFSQILDFSLTCLLLINSAI